MVGKLCSQAAIVHVFQKKKKSKAEQTEIISFLENQLLSARTVGADKHQQR